MKSIYLEADFITTRDVGKFILEIDADISIFKVKVETGSLEEESQYEM